MIAHIPEILCSGAQEVSRKFTIRYMILMTLPKERGRIAYFHDEFLAVRAQYNAIEDPALRSQFLQDRKKELRKREEVRYLLLCA
jgi:hypothetical protein